MIPSSYDYSSFLFYFLIIDFDVYSVIMHQFGETSNSFMNVEEDFVQNTNEDEEDEEGEAQLNSMQVACAVEEDRTWIDNMVVNNEAIIFENRQPMDEVNADEDIVMDDPLTDDLCNATIMANSIMQNCQLEAEVFGRECVEKGPRIGLIFNKRKSHRTIK